MSKWDSVRHPDLDKTWEDCRLLAWKIACKCANINGGEANDYIGHLFIFMNRCLHSYNPNRGTKFSTWFARSALADTWKNSLCGTWSLVYIDRFGTFEQINEGHRHKIPEPCDKVDRPFNRALDMDPHDSMSLAIRDAGLREAYCVLMTQAYNEAAHVVGKRLGISRERVRQLKIRGISRCG